MFCGVDAPIGLARTSPWAFKFGLVVNPGKFGLLKPSPVAPGGEQFDHLSQQGGCTAWFSKLLGFVDWS
ncbi:hypothetical protein NIES2098_42080 [Calothrix sp. NIES-2098]|nr:hypothetical protein NIES2098_42080 [Calothrix sp. NIES-2098]